MVHFGIVEQIAKQRQEVLDKAYHANPSRFSKPPVVKLPALEVYINPPLNIGIENARSAEEKRCGAIAASPHSFTQPEPVAAFL